MTTLALSLSPIGCREASVVPDASLDAGAAFDAAAVDAAPPAPDAPHDTNAGAPEARLLALSREGRVASIDIAAPWTVRATTDLGATIASARCRGAVCLVVHPSPIDAVTILDALDLTVRATVTLERGADPRDVAILDERTAIVSQDDRSELLVLDLVTRTTSPLELAILADADGLPEAGRMASCGRRVFVQLRRVEHATETPSAIGSALAVIDLDREPDDRIVDADPNAEGVQAIALAGAPAFDMPVDCEAGVLDVAEPMPLFSGGGTHERIDLLTLAAGESPVSVVVEVGGFEIVEPGLYWIISHTEFGPASSSHLTLEGGPTPDAYNTFWAEHVNDLALDRAEDLLFFPDPCTPTASFACETGVHVFDARSGDPAAEHAIDVGFSPIELALTR